MEGFNPHPNLPPARGKGRILRDEAARRRLEQGDRFSEFTVLFANLYLDDFDHYMKETLRCKAYLRYVDDTAVLDDDKTRLRDIRAAVRERLAREHLRLHPRKADISRVSDGPNLLGYIVFPNYRRMRSDNGHRFVRRLRRMADLYRDGRLGWAAIDAAVQSWIGHAQHADTWGLRQGIFSRIIFQRGTDREATSV